MERHTMSDYRESTQISRRTNLPVCTLAAAVIFVCLAIIGFIFIPEKNVTAQETLVGLIVTNVPVLIGASFAERNGRDIRNGVMEQKVKDGSIKALKETGVTDVVDASGRGASSAAAIQALTASTLALSKIMDKMEMSK
jgi:hypothetical protein